MYSEYTESHAKHRALLAMEAVGFPYRTKALKILSGNPDGLSYTALCVLTGKDPDVDEGVFVFHLKILEGGGLIEKNPIGRYEVTSLGKYVLDFQKHLERYLKSMKGKKIPVISREIVLIQKLEEPQKLDTVIKLPDIQNIKY